MSNIVWHAHAVDKESRADQKGQKPLVIWFTGLSGAGKSTLAGALEQALAAQGKHTYLLDGDNVRHGLCGDLGFDDAARQENIRRVGEVAELVVDGPPGRPVPPSDVARLAEAIAELFADPERAVAMGKAGCERVQAQFSLDAMVRAYLSLYEEQVKAARNGVQSAAQSRNALR